MRVVLFTLDSPLSAAAVTAFLNRHGAEVVLIGRSLPYRPGAGGPLRQGWRHWRRSGRRFLPYLWVNYALPQVVGRGGLARWAAARGLPCLAVEDVNGPAMAAAIRAAGPDLLVSLHFDQIFAGATLALAPRGGINLHPSLLPAHRGPVPTIWALAEPVPRFGVTVHRLAPRIDAGPILAQREVPLPPGITASAAARALHLAGVPLLSEAIARLERGEVAERAVAPLPYCPFPPPGLLRDLARQGRRLVGWGDLRAALR